MHLRTHWKQTSLLSLVLLFAGNAMALSPPWYLLQRQVAAAIGADTGVLVDDLDTTITPYRINVHVADSNRAQALASILTPHYDMGNLAVDVRVLDGNGMEVQPLSLTTSQDVVNAVAAALSTNPLFLLAVETRLPFQGGGVGVVFQKVLLQYFSDDIGELFGNTNISAAAVFGNILTMKYGDVPLKLGTARSASAEN